MSLFKKLFGVRNIEDEKVSIIQEMKSMTKDAERVYRNLVGQYSVLFSKTASLSGRGLFKARLLAALFMARAFGLRWPEEEDHFMEVMNLATAVAIEPLVEAQSDPQLSRNEAKTLFLDYMKKVICGINNELKAGPSSLLHETEGFQELAELYHEALRDSIGTSDYTPEVRNHFHNAVGLQINAGLGHMWKIAEEERGRS